MAQTDIEREDAELGTPEGQWRETATRLRLTVAQRAAVEALYKRNPDGTANLAEFSERLLFEFCGGGCVLLRWCGMTVGVEPDGYTHS